MGDEQRALAGAVVVQHVHDLHGCVCLARARRPHHHRQPRLSACSDSFHLETHSACQSLSMSANVEGTLAKDSYDAGLGLVSSRSDNIPLSMACSLHILTSARKGIGERTRLVLLQTLQDNRIFPERLTNRFGHRLALLTGAPSHTQSSKDMKRSRPAQA